MPRSLWFKVGEKGLLCTEAPEEYGGGDFLFGAIMVEETARAGATGPTFYLHSDIITPYLLYYGTEEQKQRWLPRMATGEVITCLGMSQPSGDNDPANILTSARRDGDEYIINGQKVFISARRNAYLIVHACKTDPAAGARGVSLILVEIDRPGFQRGRKLEKIGCKAQDTAELFFNELRVPVSKLLGQEGRGFHQMMRELSQQRLVRVIRAVSSCEVALEWTIDYAVQREIFGHTLANFQNTQFKLAEIKAEVTMQRVFLDRCTELHLRRGLDSADAAILKLVTTEMQGRVMDQCLQFFGACGYMWEYPITRAFVDAKLGRIGGDSVEVMKQIIWRAMSVKDTKPNRTH